MSSFFELVAAIVVSFVLAPIAAIVAAVILAAVVVVAFLGAAWLFDRFESIQRWFK